MANDLTNALTGFVFLAVLLLIAVNYCSASFHCGMRKEGYSTLGWIQDKYQMGLAHARSMEEVGRMSSVEQVAEYEGAGLPRDRQRVIKTGSVLNPPVVTIFPTNRLTPTEKKTLVNMKTKRKMANQQRRR